MKQNQFKKGDKVKYKDGDNRIFYVYDLYGENAVSLGQYEYPEIEQDYQVENKDIKLFMDKEKLEQLKDMLISFRNSDIFGIAEMTEIEQIDTVIQLVDSTIINNN